MKIPLRVLLPLGAFLAIAYVFAIKKSQSQHDNPQAPYISAYELEGQARRAYAGKDYALAERLIKPSMQIYANTYDAQIASDEADAVYCSRYHLLAWCCFYQKKYQEAVGYLGNALTHASNLNQFMVNTIGFLYHVQGHYEEAEIWYAKSLKNNYTLDNLVSHCNLAFLFCQTGRHEEKQRELRQIPERVFKAEVPEPKKLYLFSTSDRWTMDQFAQENFYKAQWDRAVKTGNKECLPAIYANLLVLYLDSSRNNYIDYFPEQMRMLRDLLESGEKELGPVPLVAVTSYRMSDRAWTFIHQMKHRLEPSDLDGPIKDFLHTLEIAGQSSSLPAGFKAKTLLWLGLLSLEKSGLVIPDSPEYRKNLEEAKDFYERILRTGLEEMGKNSVYVEAAKNKLQEIEGKLKAQPAVQ